MSNRKVEKRVVPVPLAEAARLKPVVLRAMLPDVQHQRIKALAMKHGCQRGAVVTALLLRGLVKGKVAMCVVG